MKRLRLYPEPFQALAVLFLVAAIITQCAKSAIPLSPAGQLTLQANQAVVALGTLQHTAIELNKVQDCRAGATMCKPLLSESNTRVVVENTVTALQAIRAAPQGYKAASLNALNVIKMRLDAEGKPQIGSWLEVAETIINQLP